MSKFGIMDIVALAKAGYSVSDVKELISLSSSEEKEPEKQEEKEPAKKTDEPEDAKDTSAEDPQKSTEDPAKVTAIDEYKKQVEELKKQVKDLQDKNVHQDNSGNENEKSDEDILNEITRSFM